MKLSKLLENQDMNCVYADAGTTEHPGEIEITSIATDNRKCGPGALFVCIRGYVTDGHKYASSAAKAGAAAILAESMDSLRAYGFEPETSKTVVVLCPDM